jgi:hypothetical protein
MAALVVKAVDRAVQVAAAVTLVVPVDQVLQVKDMAEVMLLQEIQTAVGTKVPAAVLVVLQLMELLVRHHIQVQDYQIQLPVHQ